MALVHFTVFHNSKSTIQKFVSWADEEITELLKVFSLMKQEYNSVMKFYGEDTAKTRIDDFFSTFASFISDFEVKITGDI